MELALLSPWVIFLFVGALDWGFYAYSMVSIETAARSAASAIASQSDVKAISSSAACTTVLAELSTLTNIGTTVTSCGAAPLIVSATQVASVDGNPAVQVSLTYTTPNMIPIPGLLAKQFTITRTVTMRVT
jgi:hypothetical protein